MRHALFSPWQQKALSLLMALSLTTPAWADLQTTLEHQFDEMANTTAPASMKANDAAYWQADNSSLKTTCSTKI